MKKLFALLLLAVIVVFPACNSSTSNDDNGGNNGGTTGSASTYLPFKTGNSWTFTSTDESGSSTSTETIIGNATIGGKTYWMMKSDESSFADTTYFRVADNNLYEILDASDYAEFMGGVTKSAKVAAAFKAASSTETEVIFAKFGVSAGTTWTVYDVSIPTGGKVSIKGKYVGQETVQTTAGTFASCAKFEISSGYSMNYEGISVSMTGTNTMWFAPNVGPVKMSDVSVSSFGGQSQTSTSTNILKSYTVQ